MLHQLYHLLTKVENLYKTLWHVVCHSNESWNPVKKGLYETSIGIQCVFIDDHYVFSIPVYAQVENQAPFIETLVAVNAIKLGTSLPVPVYTR